MNYIENCYKILITQPDMRGVFWVSFLTAFKNVLMNRPNKVVYYMFLIYIILFYICLLQVIKQRGLCVQQEGTQCNQHLASVSQLQFTASFSGVMKLCNTGFVTEPL